MLESETYLEVLQGFWEVLEELDVLDLVLRSVDGEEILQVDNFSDVADVVLAQVQDLQVHVRAQVSTQLLDFFFLQV